MYRTWFRKFEPHGCCPESDLGWKEHGAIQNVDILGCLARSHNNLNCWKSNETSVNVMLNAYTRKS